MTNKKNNINDRLKYLRTSLLNMTLETFGNKIGMTRSAVSQMEKGRRVVSERTIKLICSEFKISESWIREGMGEPEFDKYQFKANLTDLEKDILTKFNILDDNDKKSIEAIINSLSVKNKKDE